MKTEAAKPISIVKPQASSPASPESVSLKAICAELKLDPRLAREKLRIAAREAKKFPELAKTHRPRSAWEWPKGSEAEKQARTALVV